MASLSVVDLGGGRYKIRWRELAPGPDGKPVRGDDGRLVRRARSLVVVGKEARDREVARIRRALVDEGEYAPATASSAAPVANLEQAALAWLRWKQTRCTASSCRRYAEHLGRWFRTVRSLRGIATSGVVRVTELSRDLLTSAIREWQGDGVSESVVYGTARSILEMWRWVSDDPEQYPGVPFPPREAKAVLPRPPLYIAPPAPTLAECDACLRHLPADAVLSRRLGAWMRFTGLRASQVLPIRRSDVDLDAAVLTVRVGKSRIEKAECRRIPLARALIADVRGWVEPLGGEALLFPAWNRRETDDPRPAIIKPDTFRAAWQEAVAAGEAQEMSSHLIHGPA